MPLDIRYHRILLILLALIAWSISLAVDAAERLERSAVLRQSTQAVELLHPSGEHELALPISLQCPRFVFNTGAIGGDQPPTAVSGDLLAGEEFVAHYAPLALSPSGTLEVRMHLAWSDGEAVLRKWIEYRLLAAPARCVLHEIQFDQLAPVAGQPIGFLAAPPQSQPGFLRGFFAGVEFPVASTRMEGERLALIQRPGRLIEGDTGWRKSHSALYGAAPVGREREVFGALIDSHRPAPKSLHFNYNTWWSMGFPCSQQDVLDLMKPFDDNLFKAHGVPLDMFAIDMGWSDPKTFWGISKPHFPEGFAPVKAQAERMGSHLGLWISPSSCYPPALDNKWARAEGYETYTVPRADKFLAACIAGPKYREAFKARLVSLATESGVRHFKLDGYWLGCPESSHGHQPDADSHEAIADAGIAAFEAVRAAAPEVLLELINLGYNPSPWWLYHVNVVHGAYGDDSPPGCVPCPIERESMTSGRDFFNLQGAALIPLPETAQEVFGILHQTNDPFMNDAVDVILRGHAFVPLYINPKFMTPRRWGMLAGLITWARANEATLAQSSPLLPEAWRSGVALPQLTSKGIMPREPYGYAHWAGGRGLILLRNPWVAQQSLQVELLDQAGVPKGTEGLSAVSLYPEVRLYGKDLPAESTLDVTLAPYETVLISLRADQPTAGLKPAREAIGRELRAAPAALTTSRVRYEDAATSTVRGPDWTVQYDNITDGVELSMQGEVEAAAASSPELLIILEAKGHSPAVGHSSLVLNGRETQLKEMHSESQWVATGLPAPEFWTILKAPLDPGTNRIDLKLLCENETTTVSCWAWAYRQTGEEPSAYPNALPSPEMLYLASKPLLELQAIPAGGAPESLQRPVVRIDGVYLDTLKPLEATQEFGTPQINQNITQKPLRIGSRYFPRGLGSHSKARIVYDLARADQGFRRFQAWVGADSQNPVSSISFTILVDGQPRWESGVMSAQDPARLADVNVTGAKKLELVVDDAGDGNVCDHADFGDAKLLR